MCDSVLVGVYFRAHLTNVTAIINILLLGIPLHYSFFMSVLETTELQVAVCVGSCSA